VTLLFLTDLFYFLPQAVLAAIIMTAIVGLIDLEAVKHLWQVKRDGLVILVLTFASTLLIGIEEGLAIGIGASLVWFVIRATRPHTAVLGRIPGTTSYRNLERHPEAKTIPGLLLLRIDSQFFFGNVSFLKDTLVALEKEMDEPLQAVIIDASSINQLDSSAELALHRILEDYQERGIELYFAKAKGPVLDVMRASKFFQDLGEEYFTYRVHQAVEKACQKCFDVDDPSILE
jgi:sulfate permease, SulP family